MSRTSSLCIAVWLLFTLGVRTAESNQVQVIRDIPYARISELTLNLDLHLPREKPRAPLIVWVHGGAWRSGSKKDMPLAKLVEEGYAVKIPGADPRPQGGDSFPARARQRVAAADEENSHRR
jgi:hypothetical protein